MKKLLLWVFSTILLFSAKSQIIINNLANPYTQDFNTLASAATSNVLPTGWAFLEVGNNANDTYAADNGTLNSGNTYSYGAANNAERAFGTILSGSVTPTIGVQFTNNSGATITSITVSYTGEQWRLGTANREDRLDFQYSTDATSLSNGTYIHVDQLDFVAPVTVLPIGALDGNAPANKKNIAAFEIAGLNIPNGTTFWLRWTDFNASGADDGLAIDDVTVTFNGNANPPCIEPVAQPTNLILNPTPTTISGGFTAAVPPADEYLVVRSLVSPLGASPVDGISYAPGDALGNGTVVSVGPTTNFVTNGLVPNTQYFFFVFALNNENCGGGPNYNNTNPLEQSANTLPLPACVVPPNPPTNLNLIPGNTSVVGSFNAVVGANRYLVVRSTNNVLGFTPTNGVTYAPGQVIGADVIVSYNNSTNFNAGGLVANTQYFFFVFAANSECTGEPFYNTTSLNGTATTTQGGQGIPPGYYQSADGLACSELKTALFNIIKPIVANPVPDYAGICDIYTSTDLRKSDDGLRDIIWDMYSDNPGINNPDPYEFEFGVDVDGCGGAPDNPPLPGTNEGQMYNREHSFPRNWFGGQIEPMNSDIMHIFPTDKEVNAQRNNFPYGETNIPSWTSLNGSKLGNSTFPGYNGIVFEPIDEYKGDLARAQLYMATCYEDKVAGWVNNNPAILIGEKYLSFTPWYLQLLYKWHLQDPVSDKEIARNNAVYAIQGNRNPFVDHPEYVTAIWGCSGVLPVTVTSFNISKNGSTALLKWTATLETNFKLYEIEQSTDGIVFTKISEVKGNNLPNYSFNVSNLPVAKVVYYRLKMIDIDNKFTYSKTVSLQLNSANTSKILVYPNPASSNITVKLDHSLAEAGEIKIADFTGRTVLQQKINTGHQIIDLNVSKLPVGKYFIRIADNNSVINQTFVISR